MVEGDRPDGRPETDLLREGRSFTYEEVGDSKTIEHGQFATRQVLGHPAFGEPKFVGDDDLREILVVGIGWNRVLAGAVREETEFHVPDDPLRALRAASCSFASAITLRTAMPPILLSRTPPPIGTQGGRPGYPHPRPPA